MMPLLASGASQAVEVSYLASATVDLILNPLLVGRDYPRHRPRP